MKRIVVVLSAVALLLGVSSVDAVTFSVRSGFVQYEVQLKTLGIGSGDVTAVNREVTGRIVTTPEGRVDGSLVVTVTGFDSKNTRRDKDVANILKYREHPTIAFEVVDVTAEDIARVLQSDSGTVKLKAKITAAGGSKVYDAVLDFHHIGPHLIRFTTSITAKFTDFGINPPSFGLFLRTAPDRLVLGCDLLVDTQAETRGGAQGQP